MELLFDITAKDISKLNDEDLRSLVGLLCEAEYSSANLPVSDITWGGDQNSSDGGLDVVVNSKQDYLTPLAFMPRGNTGYQVKKSNIQPAGIKTEMKPKGLLRESIKKLIKEQGAYIIVSAKSVSKVFLERRLDAMRKSVSREPNQKKLHLDFLDGSRLASWVRKHPSVILWLRKKIDQQLRGWQPFANWSGNPGTPSEQYIPDDGLRLRQATDAEGKEMDSISGLLKFRALLSTQGVSLRLTGLSGVGKTRFVQALFDPIGENPLNKNLAIYTDMSDGPDPDPKALAEQLIAQGAQAILIVDNCPPELHHRLTTTCKVPNCKINLLTIEYDVRDDLPEDTDVFILEPSSNEVIERLIISRFHWVGQVNARTIAESAGGNARVAIALAETVKKGEALSSLRNDELFTRLFKQRNPENNDLLISAEVCSLLYSFDGTKFNEDDCELKFLADIIDIQSQKLFRDVSTLKHRKLVQSRGIWRAVLPHAIANRLAKKALESIPISHIINSFEQHGTERLLVSFSRRLSYLHDSPHAIEIASGWLRPDGLLGKSNGYLNNFGLSILTNIAPVVPLNILEFMEHAEEGNSTFKFASRENPHFNKMVKLLRLIAYDPDLFYRSTKLICRFAVTEDINENNNSIRNELGILFQLYLSGTNATVSMRSKIISELLSSNVRDQDIGLFLLKQSLKTGSFTGFNYNFGARSRGYGLQLKGNQVVEWYDHYIELCSAQATASGNLAKKIRKLLAENFRGLWRAGLHDKLEEASKQIQSFYSWIEGWTAIKNIFRYDKNHYSESTLNRLKTLEELLRPKSLIDMARAVVLANRHDSFEFEDDTDDRDLGGNWQRMELKAKELGNRVALDPETFNILLPDLLSTQNERLKSFGIGFGAGCNDLSSSWDSICIGIKNISIDKREYNFILGFLYSSASRDSKFYQATLDSLLSHDLFAIIFPALQSNLGIDEEGIKRLKLSLNLDIAHLGTYQSIPYNIQDAVEEDRIINLFENLLSKPNGILIVFESLYVRFHSDSEKSIKHSPVLVEFASKILVSYNFAGTFQDTTDHYLEFLVKECFEKNEKGAEEMCRNLKTAINNYTICDHLELAKGLASVQPMIFLNVFIGESESLEDVYLSNLGYNNENPLESISEKNIEIWCLNNLSHIPILLNCLTPFRHSAEVNRLAWKPIIFKLIEMAQNVKKALSCLTVSIETSLWGDYSHSAFQERIVLLKEMEKHQSKEIRNWSVSTQAVFEEYARKLAESENQRSRPRNETFE